MKRYISYLLIYFSVISLLSSCSKETESISCEGEIIINFVNETGKDINNLIVHSVNIGNLESNQSSGDICYKTFPIDSGMPDCITEGFYSGQQIMGTNQFYWCGTQKGFLESGKYTIRVQVVSINNTNYFNLIFAR